MTEPLSQRTVARFFWPLALSWIFMAFEQPIAISVVARMPDAVVSTAAYLVMGGIAIWIESPVIDLLSTATTLGRSRASYVALSRYVWWLIAWVTFAHAAVAFTPLYGIVAQGILKVPDEVANAARPGLMIMLPWSGLIGWRRYLQGILIRHGRTRPIGLGTAVRVVTMAVSVFGLYLFSGLPSIPLAAVGLIASVAAEAAFIHWASRPVIREVFGGPQPEEPPLTVGKLTRFHLPLVATTMVSMTSAPLVAAAIARTPAPVDGMAAYQVAVTVLFIFRASTFALPEVVITLARDDAAAAVMRRFCITLGAGATFLLLAFLASPAADWVLGAVLGTEPRIVILASLAMLLSSLQPLVNAIQGYLRGMLTAHHLTTSRMVAMGVWVGVLVLSLVAGVSLGGPGLVVAPLALTVSMAAEWAVLAAFWRRGRTRLQLGEVGVLPAEG